MSTPKHPNTTYDTHDTARLAFMLKLVDTLHSMPDACAIEDVACLLLAENLRVEFAWFAEIGPDRQQMTIRSEFTRDRSIRLAGIYPVGQLLSLVRIIEAEQPYILDDTFQSFDIESPERSFYENRRIRSCLAFPVAKGKQALTYIAIARDIPHQWTASEVSLIHETAIRIGDAIRMAGRGDHVSRRVITEEQTKNLARLQDERANLMQKLNAQVSRLHKLVRDLLADRPSARQSQGR